MTALAGSSSSSSAPANAQGVGRPAALKTVPIRCANVNHNTGPRRNHPLWGQALGTVDLQPNQPDELAATTYICEACASVFRPALAEWQAQADEHAANKNADPPGDPPSPVFA